MRLVGSIPTTQCMQLSSLALTGNLQRALRYADASQSDYVGRNCDRIRARCKPLVAEALDMANSTARHSSPVLIAIKEAERRSVESSLDDGLLFERRLFHAGFALHDQKEGMAAFLQTRAPEFLNK